jgi:hypothetical protein
MKGAASCLSLVVGAAAALIVFHRWFLSAGKELPQIWPAAIVASLCTILTLALLSNIAMTSVEWAKLRNSVRGRFPDDGKRVVLAGRIRSATPLVSPISATSVVAYKYEMQRQKSVNRTIVTLRDYEGTALAASTIETAVGPFRVLSLPGFDVPKTAPDRKDALRNAEAYVAATIFDRISYGKEEARTLEREWADDDGIYRLDQRGTDEPDLPACTLNEWIIPQDAAVCVFGRYNRARSGIVPDRRWPNTMRIMLGDATIVAATLASRVVRYTISSIITAGVVVAVCVLYFSNVR